MSKIQINLDMDGVVADFDTVWGDIMEAQGKPRDSFDFKTFTREVTENRLFTTLPMVEGAETLLTIARNWKDLSDNITLRFLSSAGGGNEKHQQSAYEQKREWLDNHGCSDIELVTVEKKSLKKNHCEGGYCILIDDHPVNISDWESAGGIGIHVPTTETIVSLVTANNLNRLIYQLHLKLEESEYGSD